MEFLDFSSSVQTDEYKQFVQNNEAGSFTQSLQWCNVKSNWKHEAIIIRNNQKEIIATMLILIKKIPFLKTTLLYSPRGPVCNFNDEDTLKKLVDGIKIIARKYHAYLFKCDPYILASDTVYIQNMKNAEFILQHDTNNSTVQCSRNYILDLKNKTASEVFQSFHSKWRYNIRLAERKGVVCKFYENDVAQDKLDDFYELMQETGKRDGFYIRSKEYFSSMLNNLNCRLYLCYYNDYPVSGAIATQYAGKTSYVYGASSNRARSVMPNYLIQWNMIQWAIENDNTVYDFLGISHYDDETHPSYGVYRFKRGFNGQIVEYAGSFDLIFSPIRIKIVDCCYRAIKGLQFIKAFKKE